MTFSYYFNNERQTSTDLDFLTELTKDCENQQEVIDGIIASKAAFDEGLRSE